MKGKVLKPIPGTGYSIGDESDFDLESQPWLIDEEYIEELTSHKEKPKQETAMNKAAENAAKPNNK